MIVNSGIARCDIDKMDVIETAKRLFEDREEYFKELKALKEDINFFNMYMKRNKKSNADFVVRISYKGTFKAFDDIWKKYWYHTSDIEIVFSEFIVLKAIIQDIYEDTNSFTKNTKKEFIDYFERYGETMVKDYVSDFIGCSRGCTAVLGKIQQIKAEKI